MSEIAIISQDSLDSLRMEEALGGELNRLEKMLALVAAMVPDEANAEHAGKVTIEFSGSGDSGGVDWIHWGIEKAGDSIDNEEFRQLAEEFVGRDVEWNVNNEGSSGQVYIDLSQPSDQRVWSEVDYYETVVANTESEFYDPATYVQRR